MANENEKQLELEAAYTWLPKAIQDIAKECREKDDSVDTIVRDAYLNKGEDKIDGKWVVDSTKAGFEGRLGTLMAEDGECRVVTENLIRAMRSSRLFGEIADSLRARVGETDDKTGLITIKEFIPIEVRDGDFPELSKAVISWLDKVWSLKDANGGLINEYVRHMSFEKKEISGVVPPMTFDEFANRKIRKMVEMELSDSRYLSALRGEGLNNALNTSEDLLKLARMDIAVIRDKVLEIIMDNMTMWQLHPFREVISIESTDERKFKRMDDARKLYDLISQYRRTGDPGVLKEVKQFFSHFDRKENV